MSIKNVLLTNIHLQNFAGTELNTLSIAKEFIRQGVEVEVATFLFGEPLAAHFQEENIRVFDLFSDEIIDKHYDLIFANHFPVIPTA